MRIAQSKQSLLDRQPAKLRWPTGVEKIEVRSNGFQFRFSDRILPGWFMHLARGLDMAVADNDVIGKLKAGRIVRLEKPQHIRH